MTQIGRQRGFAPALSDFGRAQGCAARRPRCLLKDMTFTLNVIDGVGNVLMSEAFGSPHGVLERVEALKREWAEAHAIQIRANQTPLFTIDLKRD